MDNELRIRTLADRFFSGQTTLDEEEQLYAYFSREPADLPADLRPLRQLFLDLAAVRSVATASQQPRPQRRPRRWLLAAAAVAVVLVGGALLLFSRSAPAAADDEELVAYIYGQRTTDRNVVLGEMEHTLATLTTGEEHVVEEQLKAMFSN